MFCGNCHWALLSGSQVATKQVKSVFKVNGKGRQEVQNVFTLTQILTFDEVWETGATT